MLEWHILLCDPQKLHSSICFVGWPLFWQGYAIMWPCTCNPNRWALILGCGVRQNFADFVVVVQARAQ